MSGSSSTILYLTVPVMFLPSYTITETGKGVGFMSELVG